MQGIYNYIREISLVSVAYSVAAILWLQFIAHVTLFHTLNMFRTLTVALSAVHVQSHIWFLSVVPVFPALSVLAQVIYECFWDGSGGTRWRSWLRHCATSRKVAGIFHWHNPSGRTVALGSTQPPTEMSTRNIPWGGKDGRCVGLTTLPPFMCRLSWNLGASTSWNPQGLSRPVMGLLYFT